MTLLKRFNSGILLFLAAFTLFSCNLEDFNLKKLVDPVDIVPDFFAPLAYGTFTVTDLIPVPKPDDNFQIPVGGIDLSPVVVSTLGTSFRSEAIDSVYLITQFTNETQCDMEFELFFLSSATGLPVNIKLFKSGIIPANSPEKRIQFDLGPTDLDNLNNSSDIRLNFKFSPPATGITTFGDVKSQVFSFKISFHSPVNLWKL